MKTRKNTECTESCDVLKTFEFLWMEILLVPKPQALQDRTCIRAVSEQKAQGKNYDGSE